MAVSATRNIAEGSYSRAVAPSLAPAVFTVASGPTVINALWSDLVGPILRGATFGPAAAGLLVISLGVPVYFMLRLRAAAADSRGSSSSEPRITQTHAKIRDSVTARSVTDCPLPTGRCLLP